MPLVALYHGRLDVTDAEITRLAGLLDDTERSHADRFHFALHRRRFIARRGRLREWLGHELMLPPALIPIHTTDNGKPEVPGWHRCFSTSHAGDRMLIASASVALGCDIEVITPDTHWRGIAEELFACEERQTLRHLDDVEGRQSFFRCWVRKEAFVKALGAGLAYPLTAFAVSCGVQAEFLRGGQGWVIAALTLPDQPESVAGKAADSGAYAGAVVARADGTPLVLTNASLPLPAN